MSVLFTRRGTPPAGGSGGGGISGTLASDLAVGTSVFLSVDGVNTEFLIVHQGNPSTSMYDSSCDGIWLLMKDCYEKRQWHSSDSNSYKASTIHTYLNGTFLGLFDTDVQSAIKQVKIPYVNGTGGSAVASGANGLSAQIFLLAGREVGITSSISQFYPDDGACLSYFSGSTASSKRIAYMNGTAINWWLRSPRTEATNTACGVEDNGDDYQKVCSNSNLGVRPALILPSNALFDPLTKEFVGVGGGNSSDNGENDDESGTYTVTITGTGDSNALFVKINGTMYTAAATLTVEGGTTIELQTVYMPALNASGYIQVDGVSVGTLSGNYLKYSMTVSSNVTIALNQNSDFGIIVTTN